MKHIKNITVWSLFLLITGVAMAPELYAGERPLDTADSDLQKIVERAEEAGISAEKIETLIQRGRQKGLSDDQIGDLIQPATELAENDLPGEMIIQKAFEGLAKGIPPNRIEPVILDLRSRIQKARNIVDPWMEQNKSDEDNRYITVRGDEQTIRSLLIESTAQALSGDMKAERISELLDFLEKNTEVEKRQPGKLAAAIRVLSDLITTDEHPGISNRLLANAINAGFAASDLNQLPQAMKMAQQNTRLPSKAVASGFTRQVENGLSATQIIQNLQSGNVKGGGTPPKLQKNKRQGPDQNPAADKKNNNGADGK